jgi:trehalose 6-phosphate synthase/phosphatase
VREYQLFIEEIESLVGKINGTHATVENIPVHFMHRSINFHELCALYNMADIALVTPLFDGMNLVAKEYLACQDQGKGMLVLSEFAGAADELFSAEIVNPYNISQLVNTLYQVFTMDPDVKRKRMEFMREHVIKYDSNHWAATFLKELSAIEPEDIQVIAASEEMDEIVTPFAGIGHAAFFIDYDGTLREFEDVPGAASPTKEIMEILDILNATGKIDLYIISGRKRQDLESWFSDFPGTLIAEHGLVYKNPHSSEWEHIGEPREDTWKKDILSIFHRFEGVTPGSLTEEKSSSVVWHFRRCDPEFGKIKANMLLEELYEIPSNLPLEVHQGHKIIEVSSMYVNKGAAVLYFTGKAQHDIVFCAGDDYTDESMFQTELQNQVNVKVGEGMTRAEYRVKNPKTFHRLLRNIANVVK